MDQNSIDMLNLGLIDELRSKYLEQTRVAATIVHVAQGYHKNQTIASGALNVEFSYEFANKKAVEIRLQGHDYRTLVEAMLGEDSQGVRNDKDVAFELTKHVTLTLHQIRESGIPLSRRVQHSALDETYAAIYTMRFDLV